LVQETTKGRRSVEDGHEAKPVYSWWFIVKGVKAGNHMLGTKKKNHAGREGPAGRHLKELFLAMPASGSEFSAIA
jgi:hypothetical protein